VAGIIRIVDDENVDTDDEAHRQPLRGRQAGEVDAASEGATPAPAAVDPGDCMSDLDDL
jgi:hypothetical protein